MNPLLLLLALPQTPAGPALIELREAPVQGRLYTRDLATGRATVPIEGDVTASGYDFVRVTVARDGRFYGLQRQALAYSAGRAPFALYQEIEAGLHAYRFRIHLEGPGGLLLAGQADEVVCGDAYLIQGQSNAVAGDNQGLANQHQSRWVRSFGRHSFWGFKTLEDLDWFLADGEKGEGKGAVGVWGLRLGELIVQQAAVPVAILNGAIGATRIRYHLRDEADPMNVDTNYGRLLFRAEEAGIRGGVRAIFWYQGEADGGTDPYLYFDQWKRLYGAWRADYPGLERVYVVQVRDGCGEPSLELRECQRQLPDHFADVGLMSSNGVPFHDGCHFPYAGYLELGNRLARLAGGELYGWPAPPGVAPPNPLRAAWDGPSRERIRIEFRDPADVLVVEAGAAADFVLEDGVSVSSVQAAGAALVLQLAAPSTSATVGYNGHRLDGPWLRNELGVGALSFLLPVE